MKKFEIIKYQNSNYNLLFEMAQKLFSNYDPELLSRDLKSSLSKDTHQCFLVTEGEFKAGFAIVSIRNDYVEGASSSPTGYLEAIFIEDNFRGNGIAKSLLNTCEEWAAERGCTEMGSDTWLSHIEAQKFHEAIGFKEDDRLVHYIKSIS